MFGTMKVNKEKIWTWFLPNQSKEICRADWMKSGGKWIVFDREDRITASLYESRARAYPRLPP